MIYVGNAPCSWGNLEFQGLDEQSLDFRQILDEISESGYAGTELGDWGFLPIEPKILHTELATRNLTMTGAFVPVDFSDSNCHAEGKARALRTAALLRNVASETSPPFVVLADDNGTHPIRTKTAGRITPDLALPKSKLEVFADGVNAIAQAVTSQFGLRCVFHHHCAGFIETPQEIADLMQLTDPNLVGLVFDTGHYAFGAGKTMGNTVMDGVIRFADRIWYVHVKDCNQAIAEEASSREWGYFESVKNGVFCELGHGVVPFEILINWLRTMSYNGFVTVEQDVLPGMGSPMQSARRNREFLAGLGL